ncbi:SCE4755 family polysaccharide monooxygenase-like protein [Sandaracinus amylolyticus]|uniref:SCE4755 family polysaccharide monooxygenase-like protein n=1 Tax=Sandaracinus amylolyticus TaxID=927083 RepID=UPI001F26C7A7|nr:SCE4755 family polysaccharide monooxygenase-like protein [Sandaracinus amylolyticus]UJR82943.1 Hypothetical protein I5071_50080 [Sandaracinus amylolyticus]
MSQNRVGRGVRVGVVLLACIGLVALAPREVGAHFFLEEPSSWRDQNALGDPQKTGPCGNEGSAAETGAVTAYRTGETITITLRETIFHPGHFRVALAVDDRSELPAPPPVTPGSTDCGTVPIMDPPVFPVLADGVLPHTSALSGEQTIEVTLPAGVTCDHCTLQIMQWMSNHGAPCFYYHCADISITDVVVDAGPEADASVPRIDASTPMDAGNVDRTDAGGSPAATSSSCGCATPGRGAGARGLFAIALVGLVIVLRRCA